MQRRALDLLTHAIRLLPQNSDPQVSEMSLRLDMANVLLDMEDWERALALFKENNACGLLDDRTADAPTGHGTPGATLTYRTPVQSP